MNSPVLLRHLTDIGCSGLSYVIVPDCNFTGLARIDNLQSDNQSWKYIIDISRLSHFVYSLYMTCLENLVSA